MDPEQTVEATTKLQQVFKKLGIDATVITVQISGPLQRFKVQLKGSTQISKIEKFSEEIEMNMMAVGQPLILAERDERGAATSYVRLDIMTAHHPVVKYADLVNETDFANPDILKKYHLPVLVGTTEISKPFIIDLQTQPHLITVGITGSGKSMFLHSVIRSLEIHHKTQDIKLALIDPKLVEFGPYESSPALKYSLTGSHDGALEILEYLEETLQARLSFLAKTRCRDILEYRALRDSLPEKERGPRMPFIVVVIDEIADLLAQPKSNFQNLLCSIASKSRAAGIHFVVGTQHSTVKVISGLLKAQFPGRVALKTATAAHSRVAIDRNGAEKLLGLGDGLFLDAGGDLKRFKGALVEVPVSIKKRKTPPKHAEKKGFLERILDELAGD